MSKLKKMQKTIDLEMLIPSPDGMLNLTYVWHLSGSPKSTTPSLFALKVIGRPNIENNCIFFGNELVARYVNLELYAKPKYFFKFCKELDKANGNKQFKGIKKAYKSVRESMCDNVFGHIVNLENEGKKVTSELLSGDFCFHPEYMDSILNHMVECGDISRQTVIVSAYNSAEKQVPVQQQQQTPIRQQPIQYPVKQPFIEQVYQPLQQQHPVQQQYPAQLSKDGVSPW